MLIKQNIFWTGTHHQYNIFRSLFHIFYVIEIDDLYQYKKSVLSWSYVCMKYYIHVKMNMISFLYMLIEYMLLNIKQAKHKLRLYVVWAIG